MDNRLFIDFESRSELSLKEVNASVYSNHPSTEILCMVLTLPNGQSIPFTINDNFSNTLVSRHIEGLIDDKVLVSHNAAFEQFIWNNILHKRYGYEYLPPSRFKCTMAKVCAHALPRSLEQSAEALGLSQVKDMAGKKLMLELSASKGEIPKEKLDRLVQYCAQDNLTAIGIDNALDDLSEYEQKVWEMDQRINQRGINTDLALATRIKQLAGAEQENAEKEFQILVDHEFERPTQRVKLLNWLKQNGLDLPNTQKSTIQAVDLSAQSGKVQRAIELYNLMSKTSVAKFTKLINSVDSDGRLRCNTIYHGASTGRWTGGAESSEGKVASTQLQNLKRPDFDPTLAIDIIENAELIWPCLAGSVSEVASSLSRSCLIASEGNKLVSVDYSGIEARVLAWVAGQEDLIEVFRQGKCVYCAAASTTYNRLITKKENPDERQVGKGQILAFGYEGGIAAMYKICTQGRISLIPAIKPIWDSSTPTEREKAEWSYKNYQREAEKLKSPHFNKEEGITADILKQRYREANPKIVKFWVGAKTAAFSAIQHPGRRFIAPNGKVAFIYTGDWLNCYLPSGRPLHYFKPELRAQKNRFGEMVQTLTYLGINPKTKQLERESTYGGKLTENIVQAISRDIMVEGMINVEELR